LEYAEMRKEIGYAKCPGAIQGSDMENVLQSELRRAANDRVFKSVVVEGGEDGYFACECGSGTCRQQIEISLVEYAASRDERILSPGHAVAEPSFAGEKNSG
jgi:hypothetical protein